MKKKLRSNHEKNKKASFSSLYRKLKKKEKEGEKEREAYLNILSSTLNLPSDILTGAPIITIIGKSEISIENYKRVIEYTDTNLKVVTNVGNILIQGKNIKITYFASDEMKVTGRFKQINYGSLKEQV